MLERGTYEIASEIIKAECFYVDAHRMIFEAFTRLFKKRIPIDIITTSEELKLSKELDLIGGHYAVTRLTNSVTSSAHIDSHCKKMYEYFIRRELARVSRETEVESYDDSIDSFELLTNSEYKIRCITSGVSELKRVKISTVAANVFSKFVDRVENARQGIEDPNLVYTGMEDWDHYNGPLFPGGVYVVASRPGMGKGVVMTQLAVNMSRKVPVGILNGEMTENQLVTRIGCNLLGLDNEMLNKKPELITDDEIQLMHDAMEAAQSLDIHIEGTQDIDKAKAKMHTWVKLHGVKVVMLDFITLYKTKGNKRYMDQTQQAEYVMDVLVETAKELNIPIIAFAQLNRDSIAKGNVREPNLSDLKRAGEIEEKAFQVLVLHRPEYYTPDQPTDEMGNSTHGLMYMICLKHRDGKVFRLKKKFLGASSRIEDWEDEYIPFSPVRDMQVAVSNYRFPYKDNDDDNIPLRMFVFKLRTFHTII